MVLPFLALLLPILPCLSCLSTANSLKSKSSNKTKNDTNNTDTDKNNIDTGTNKSHLCRNHQVQPIMQPVVYNFEPLPPIFNLPPAKTKPITLFEVNEFHGKYNSIRY
jgi:hypothetical protein